MLWELHASGVETKSGLREYIERRLTFALSRFGSGVIKASVYLTDNNGPKGGIDKSCRIVVRLRGLNDAIAEVVDTDWPVTVDRATSRIGHNVSRALERRRDFVHESVGRR
jgi:ribosome hibernation promoting factor